MLAQVSPLPSELHTPPVTKMCLVMVFGFVLEVAFPLLAIHRAKQPFAHRKRLLTYAILYAIYDWPHLTTISTRLVNFPKKPIFSGTEKDFPAHVYWRY